jgi:hypothetical protein
VLGEREVDRGDVREAADDARVAERVPVDPRVQPRRAVAAAEHVDHVDARLGERPLQIGGAVLVHTREVAVNLAVVRSEDDLVAELREVVGRLLDV